MLPAERLGKIMKVIREKGSADVNTLSELLSVSGATIRRDFEELEKQNLIQRTHGGAVISASTGFQPSYLNRIGEHREEKERIGAVAAELIPESGTIFIESSTTMLHALKKIGRTDGLTVVTNSLHVAIELIDHQGVNVVVTGGEFSRQSAGLIGPFAHKVLSGIQVDRAFAGISSIDVSYGMTTALTADAEVKKSIFRCSKEIVGVADSSKFGRRAFAMVAPVNVLDKLITDKGASQKDIDKLKEDGVEVILC